MKQEAKLEYMKEMVQKVAKEKGICLVTKEYEMVKNGIRHDCLLIQQPPEEMAVSWKMEESEDFDDLAKERLYQQAKELVTQYERMYKDMDAGSRNFMRWIGTWDNVKNAVLPILNDAKRFEWQKGNVPHRPFLDMEIGYRIMGDYTSVPYLKGTSIGIGYSLMELWGLTEEELNQTAMKNLHDHVRTELLSDVFQKELDEVDFVKAEYKNVFVCTNDINYYGASAVLCEEYLQEIANEKGVKELVIIPVSLHECIIETRKEEMMPFLLKLASEENPFSVDEEEILTESLYLYDAELGYRIFE